MSGKTKPLVAVGCACIMQDGRYLLAKRPRKKGGLWEFPGGKRERGESIARCLEREVFEELGLRVRARRPFLVQIARDNRSRPRWKLYFCRCEVLRGRPRALEHERLAWVTPEELERYALPKANAAAVKRLVRMRL